MSLETPKVLELPILKHFDQNALTVNNKTWRKGEKEIAFILGMVLLGTVTWGTYTYILPRVFTMVGQALGAVATAVVVIGFIIFLPAIIKGLRKLSRSFTKYLIKSDPFGELEVQKQKMIQNRNEFKGAKAKIKAIKANMESESLNAEKEAKDYQEKVLSLQTKAEAAKAKIQELERLKGAAAKDSDEYVEYQTSLMKVLSEAQRVSQMLNQSTELVRKYGSRAHVIGKLDRKLNMVDTAMEIKIADFDVSIDMLKKEAAFAQAARQATDQAKSAMMFTKDWELEYALDVVNSTVALDLATTKENLLDLDTLTSQYSMDSDELYTKLDKLADQIKTDNYNIPQSKKYNNPNYNLTEQDKQASGGFDNIF